jgi:hypothetical protein
MNTALAFFCAPGGDRSAPLSAGLFGNFAGAG